MKPPVQGEQAGRSRAGIRAQAPRGLVLTMVPLPKVRGDLKAGLGPWISLFSSTVVFFICFSLS